MCQLYSPNMLKTFEICPKKFFFRYVKNIAMPVNDDIFEFGKNIHALASYYLKGDNIDRMELSLTDKEQLVWNYLKSIKYFSYDLIGSELSLSLKLKSYFIGGRIDAIVKNGKDFFILDYKTGSAPKNSKYDYQTMVYTLAVSQYFNTNNISFVYIDLKNKEEVVIKFSDNLAKEYEDRIMNIINKINNDYDFHKKSECHCEYSSICY